MTEDINFENTAEDAILPEASLSGVPSTGKKLGVALVGLGKYSSTQLAPALMETRYCRLTAIVTGSPEKIPEWKNKYGIPDSHIYNYENFDTIISNPDVDIVYIVLPNSQHATFTIRAADAGKHVICEKPMAITAAECDAMIEACQQSGTLLSIGYRLHHDLYHQEIISMGQEETFGKLEYIHAQHSQKNVEGWRLDKSLAGGGPLMDLGIYCLQAACYVSGKKPVSVKATNWSPQEVANRDILEMSVAFEITFEDGLKALCETSYTEDQNLFHAKAAHGWFELTPAYSYRDLTGKSATGFINFPAVNQQALQMDDFARSILENKPVKLDGEMGKRDVLIMNAIYESIKTGQSVPIT